jgi:hypothetical protein
MQNDECRMPVNGSGGAGGGRRLALLRRRDAVRRGGGRGRRFGPALGAADGE